MATHGFYVDVTPSERERQDQVAAAVTVIAEARAGIEQAKGMLMLIYGMDEPAAFELLKWRSQETNVKLRLLAANDPLKTPRGCGLRLTSPQRSG